MLQEELAHYKKILLMKKQEIIEMQDHQKDDGIDITIIDANGGSHYTTHPADMATDQEEHRKSCLLASRESKMLNRIDMALERIEDGTFNGLCMICGQPIDKERLEAVPHALKCILCKKTNGENGDEQGQELSEAILYLNERLSATCGPGEVVAVLQQ
jgi:RNA polymerase-binding protein DksA